MNPLHWTLPHRLAWLIVSIMGAIAGVLCAYIRSPYLFAPEGWRVFETWLSTPGLYWMWAALGFMATAVIFYLAQLGRASN